MLYWWPDDGWQHGTVVRPCPRGAFSHVVAYNRQTSALRGTADSDTLLDAASYGSRWVLLAGPGGGCGPGPLTPGLPTPSLSLVGGSSQLPAGRSTDIRIECSAFYTLHFTPVLYN